MRQKLKQCEETNCEKLIRSYAAQYRLGDGETQEQMKSICREGVAAFEEVADTRHT
jgi:hypothetical protein